MFTRPQIPGPEPRAGFSEAAPVRSSSRRRVRTLKCGAAGAMLLLGAVALLASSSYVISDNAVVTAELVSLRAPIEGMVEARDGATGRFMQAGAFLTRIVNPLIDERQLAAVQGRLARLSSDRAALQQQKTTLSAIQDDLARRAARHREAKVAELAIEADRARRDRFAKSAELEQLVRDMRRASALDGVVSRVEVERTESAVRVTAQQVQSLEQQVAAVLAQSRSAEAGVLIDANSGNDVAYSDQRADEVRIRLAELDRMIAGHEAEIVEARVQLAGEQDRLDHLQQARIIAPSDAMIWRMGAAQGERVAPGSLLAQLVDCGTAFLAIAVSQDRVPDVVVGSTASFRLSGEHVDRLGTVVAVTGDTAFRDNVALAAVPVAGARPTGSVLVSVPPSPNTAGACLVGRTARVRLPVAGSTWGEQVNRTIHRLSFWLVPW